MQRQGEVPRVITYNALISACGKGKQAEWAQELFEAADDDGVADEGAPDEEEAADGNEDDEAAEDGNEGDQDAEEDEEEKQGEGAVVSCELAPPHFA